ncbi:MAG: DUF502 domain-containing protein [Proteobacteria bacterium]|nr:DUF502 domain-containing protein [Pseudomonadota bacterium]
MWKRLRSRLVTILRRNFVAGLLVFVPVGFTLFGVMWILDQLDSLVLPRIFRALGLETGPPRFAGVLVTIGAILFVGLLTRSFLGRWVLSAWERVIDRVPIARSLYSVLKQFMQAVVGEGAYGESFQRVVIIEYPRQGLYSYAFVTGRAELEDSGPLLKVFVSSTPNPTTGYYLLVPENDAIDTDLSVEEAFRLIVSAGIAEPERPQAALRAAGAP